MIAQTLAQHTEDCLGDGALVAQNISQTTLGALCRRRGTVPYTPPCGPVFVLRGGSYRVGVVGGTVYAAAV